MSAKVESLKHKSKESQGQAVEGEIMPNGRGGARPGAGRPKGQMEPHTIEKMEAKKKFEERVAKSADRLYNAQMSAALGLQYVFKRYKISDKKWSKFEIVTDQEEILKYLDGDYAKDKDKVYYMITAEKPNLQAIDSLLDRAFGKAPQNLNLKDDREDPIKKILLAFGVLKEGDDDAGETETTPS